MDLWGGGGCWGWTVSFQTKYTATNLWYRRSHGVIYVAVVLYDMNSTTPLKYSHSAMQFLKRGKESSRMRERLSFELTICPLRV